MGRDESGKMSSCLTPALHCRKRVLGCRPFSRFDPKGNLVGTSEKDRGWVYSGGGGRGHYDWTEHN